MTRFVKKEIRLLLPVWCSIFALEIVTPWMFPWILESFNLAAAVFFLGLVVLAVDSFGREFSLGTFQNLMSQPIERTKIWQTKIKLLVWGAFLIFAGFFASNCLRLLFAIAYVDDPWRVTSGTMQSDFFSAMGSSLVLLVIAISGGLWTTLLFRQIAAAFWITLLLPILALLLLSFFLPEKLGENQLFVNLLFVVFAGVYGWWGFRLARQLFLHAEDVAWTGGVIDFSRWRYFERDGRSAKSSRRLRPFAALLKKELQLQSVSFICGGALLATHLVVIVLRKVAGQMNPASTMAVIVQNYWALWLVMPLLVGGTVIAEERKLNMTDAQFCLPVSRRKQFGVKLMVTMTLGVLFGGLTPFLLELGSADLGLPNNLFTANNFSSQTVFDGLEGVVCLSAALSLLSIFASSLSRQFLQALMITFVAGISLGVFDFFLTVFSFHGNNYQPETLQLWSWQVAMFVAAPALTALFLWLAWRNYKLFYEHKRRVRMNIIAIGGTLVFIVAGSTAIYNRAWEYFEPVAPAYGPAKLSIANPPDLRIEDNNILSVRLPDGRVWLDRLELQEAGNHFSFPMLASADFAKFISGSNWMSVAVRYNEGYNRQNYYQVDGYLDTVGVQSNGTLWVSVRSDNGGWSVDQLAQFGDNSDWQQVARVDATSVILLKTNDTLWRWGKDQFVWHSAAVAKSWPGLHTFQPFQLGTNSDWVAIGKRGDSFARKRDGSVWEVSHLDANGVDGLRRMTNFNLVPPEVPQFQFLGWATYVRKDGTLWLSFFVNSVKRGGVVESFRQLQISHETNWLSATLAGSWIVALRTDGTLWKWKAYSIDHISKAPEPLGPQSNWVALGGFAGNLVSLSADGGLWTLSGSAADLHPETWLKPSRLPVRLNNLFNAENN